jgi:phosphoribosylanthranilate isomerase
MINPKIKVCGMRDLKNIRELVKLKPDYIGFIFYEKSPRYIEPTQAKKIIDQLPPFVQTVGLFVNLYATQVDFICRRSGVDIAQIHFEANEHFFNSLQTRHIKVVRAKSKDDILKYQDQYILVDAFVEQYGGEGKRLNLDWFKDIDCSKIILAGGLNHKNLKELQDFGFYGVDVSSGVEKSKGIKSKKKMNKFCKAVDELLK